MSTIIQLTQKQSISIDLTLDSNFCASSTTKKKFRTPIVVQQLRLLLRCQFDPWPAQWVKIPICIATAAAAQIQYATELTKNKTKNKKVSANILTFYWSVPWPHYLKS